MSFLVGHSHTDKSLTYSDQELYRSRNIRYLLHTEHAAQRSRLPADLTHAANGTFMLNL